LRGALTRRRFSLDVDDVAVRPWWDGARLNDQLPQITVRQSQNHDASSMKSISIMSIQSSRQGLLRSPLIPVQKQIGCVVSTDDDIKGKSSATESFARCGGNLERSPRI